MENKKRGRLNKEWGEHAEQIALEYLFSEGYAVRERRWRAGNTIEIDIIAQTGMWIVFVEVKARKGDYQDPVDAVDEKKRSKMVKAADIYLSNLKENYQYRFDIITLTGTPESYNICHIQDAFMPPLNGKW